MYVDYSSKIILTYIGNKYHNGKLSSFADFFKYANK